MSPKAKGKVKESKGEAKAKPVSIAAAATLAASGSGAVCSGPGSGSGSGSSAPGPGAAAELVAAASGATAAGVVAAAVAPGPALGEEGDEEEKDDEDEEEEEEVAPDGPPEGGNAYEKKLRAAVIEAGGGGGVTFDIARVDLSVVCVGTYTDADKHACACGQKPLKRVFHLRHHGTGKTLDIGKACAKKFSILGKLEAQEAERALKGLLGLQEDRNAHANEDLLKFARENGLLSNAEVKYLRASCSADRERETFLKELIVVGLDLARRPDSEVAALIEGAGAVGRQAALRMAIFKGRASMMERVETSSLSTEDFRICIGDLDGQPSSKAAEPGSLIGLAVRKGLFTEARVFLNATGWGGLHALTGLYEALRVGKGAAYVGFIEEYLAHAAAEPPHGEAARMAASCADARCVQALLRWCAQHPGVGAQLVLDAALQAACAAASASVIEQVVEGGGKDLEGASLLLWCSRLSGGGAEPSNDVVALRASGESLSIAELLINTASARPRAAGWQLERNCLHAAAAAGHVGVTLLLLEQGMSPWQLTRAPPRKIRGHSELAKGGLFGAGRRFAHEVAEASESDTAAVQELLKNRMRSDLFLAQAEEFSPPAPWLLGDLQGLRQRISGNKESVSDKAVHRFRDYAMQLRERPEDAKEEAAERARAAAELAKREEDARRKAEEDRRKADEERRKQALERERAAEEFTKERERATQERQKLLEEENRNAEKQMKRRRRVLLARAVELGRCILEAGAHAGHLFEDVARSAPLYVRQAAVGELDGYMTPEFVLFAKMRLDLLEDEVDHARRNMDSGHDVLRGAADKESQWIHMRVEEARARSAELRDKSMIEALNVVLDLGATKFTKTKHIGKTYEAALAADKDWADWWLNEGPGAGSHFGRFVVARRKVSRGDILEETTRRKEAARAFKEDGLAFVLPKCEQTLGGKKHAGKTFLEVMRDDPNYASWWLREGPGEDTEFGKFAKEWEKCEFTYAEIEVARADESALHRVGRHAGHASSSRASRIQDVDIDVGMPRVDGAHRAPDEDSRPNTAASLSAEGLAPDGILAAAEGGVAHHQEAAAASEQEVQLDRVDDFASVGVAANLTETGRAPDDPAGLVELESASEEEDEEILLAACTEAERLQAVPVEAVAAGPASWLGAHAAWEATLLQFGRHKGQTYADLRRLEPGYCDWARRQPNPSPLLKDFLAFLFDSDADSMVSQRVVPQLASQSPNKRHRTSLAAETQACLSPGPRAAFSASGLPAAGARSSTSPSLAGGPPTTPAAELQACFSPREKRPQSCMSPPPDKRQRTSLASSPPHCVGHAIACVDGSPLTPSCGEGPARAIVGEVVARPLGGESSAMGDGAEWEESGDDEALVAACNNFEAAGESAGSALPPTAATQSACLDNVASASDVATSNALPAVEAQSMGPPGCSTSKGSAVSDAQFPTQAAGHPSPVVCGSAAGGAWCATISHQLIGQPASAVLTGLASGGTSTATSTCYPAAIGLAAGGSCHTTAASCSAGKPPPVVAADSASFGAWPVTSPRHQPASCGASAGLPAAGFHTGSHPAHAAAGSRSNSSLPARRPHPASLPAPAAGFHRNSSLPQQNLHPASQSALAAAGSSSSGRSPAMLAPQLASQAAPPAARSGDSDLAGLERGAPTLVPAGGARGSTVFSFGKHCGRTYETVLREQPDYCKWALACVNPQAGLLDFVEHVRLAQNGG